MKELRRDSWIYRFAYSIDPEDRRPPTQTSLCALFWRTVLFAPLCYVVFFFVSSVTSPLWVPVWLYCKLKGQSMEEFVSSKANAFSYGDTGQKLSEIKRKVCPVIRFED